MAVIDYLNRINAEQLADPFPFLGIMSARQNKLADEERQNKRADSLLESRLKFEETQAELNRKGRQKEIELQAEAYTKRLTNKEKQDAINRLIVEGFEIDPKQPIDDQLVEGMKKKAAGDSPRIRGAVSMFKDYQKRASDLNEEIVDAQTKDDEFLEKSARAMAEVEVADKLSADADERKKIGPAVSVEAINKANLSKKRRQELVAEYQALFGQSVATHRAILPSQLTKRATGDIISRLSREKLELDNDFATFRNSEPGRLAVDRIAFERGTTPDQVAPPPPKPRTSIDQIDSIRNQMRQAPTDLGTDLGQDFRDPVQPSLPSAQASRYSYGPNFSSLAGAFKDLTVGRMSDGRTTFLGLPTTSAPATGRSATGRSMGAQALPSMAPEVNALAGRVRLQMQGSPQIDALIAQMFGDDAPSLLPEAQKLAESSGVSPEAQREIFSAALSGDPAAQNQIADALNYLRQEKSQKASAAFTPTFDTGSLFPTNSIDMITPSAPSAGPFYAPAR